MTSTRSPRLRPRLGQRASQPARAVSDFREGDLPLFFAGDSIDGQMIGSRLGPVVDDVKAEIEMLGAIPPEGLPQPVVIRAALDSFMGVQKTVMTRAVQSPSITGPGRRPWQHSP